MRLRRGDALIAVNAAAGLATGIDATLAASSLAHRAALGVASAITLGSALGLTIQARRETTRAEARINYLQDTPEAYREWDRQCRSWNVTTCAAREFSENFGLVGNGRSITAHCRICGEYETDGAPLRDVMRAGIEHLRTKHKLAA